ncbi:cytochrome d ubiquinol oxidase subunit II [Terasakiella pusilla]|uniref:cytochrome d ubiquinol oxidase subunit II n=1 Tax=Terasakiella pusilla TaxID=64973 RepID=UPI003AA86797
MMDHFLTDQNWLPYLFALLMGLTMLIYVVLDGYDLGVGMLTINRGDAHKDRMIASIGPFWDANETWLVLGVGILLVAFPVAHGIILTELYLPVALMIFGLIFRGVAFDFRAKVPAERKARWNRFFFLGSLLTTLAQGYMLGSYILGFATGLGPFLFSILIALVLCSAYCLVGACWLILKCEGELQKKAVVWAKRHLFGAVVGLTAISAATPLFSPRIMEKWFSYPEIIWLAPFPILSAVLVIALYISLQKTPRPQDRKSGLPLALTIGLFILSFVGLAYSFFPYVIPDQMTILDASTSPEALTIMLWGVAIVFPVLISYTALSYYIFRGKAQDLSYD